MFTKLLISNEHPLSSKLYLDGKSYKITIKPNVVNFRFNRSHKQYFVSKHITFINKGGKKKLYLRNNRLLKKNLNKLIYQVRLVNTYTLRGLWGNSLSIAKRSGRISEYM
jgi:hypothetical protein